MVELKWWNDPDSVNWEYRFQSYHGGIEIIHTYTRMLIDLASNRTMVELKSL